MTDKIRSVVIVSFGSIGSFAFGLISQAIIAAQFGAGRELDAYYTALVIPNTLVVVFISSLNLIFIPVFTEVKEQEGEQKAWDVVGSLVANLVIVLLFAMISIFIFSESIVALIAPGLDRVSLSLATSLTRILVPIILVSALSAIVVSLLHVYGRFAWAAGGTLFGTLAYVLLLYPLSSNWGIHGLAIAAVINYCVTVVIQLAGLHGLSNYWRIPKLGLRDRNFRKLLRLWGILFSASALRRFDPVIQRYFASQTGPGSISYLSYGNRIITAIDQFFLNSVATVLFPSLARDIALTDSRRAIRRINLVLRLNGFLIIPIITGLIVIREPLVELLLQRGAFGIEDTRQVSLVLLISSALLLRSMVGSITSKALYALKAVPFLAVLSVYNVLCFLLFNLYLVPRIGYLGIVISVALYTNLSWPLQLLYLRHRLGPLGLRSVLLSYLKFFSVSVVMIAVVQAARIYLLDSPQVNSAFALASSISIGGVTYLLVASALRLPEMALVQENFVNQFNKVWQEVKVSLT